MTATDLQAPVPWRILLWLASAAAIGASTACVADASPPVGDRADPVERVEPVERADRSTDAGAVFQDVVQSLAQLAMHATPRRGRFPDGSAEARQYGVHYQSG